MALFMFVTFQLLLQVKSQGLPQPSLTIFPTSATNGENVQMVCGGHENHPVSECFFYPTGQEDFKKPSASCNLTLNSSVLVEWSQDPENTHVNMSCYYVYGQNTTSPHSDKVSVRVRGLAVMSSSPPITEDRPTTLTPNGTTEANLSTASTLDTTISLAVTSSTEIITDPITEIITDPITEIITDSITNMSSLTTHDNRSLTDPANASLESTTLTETTEHASGLAVMSSSPPITEDSPTTLTPNGTTEVPGSKKYLNKEMFFSLCVVATAGGIVLTGLMGICLYGCTRRPKDERIWIEKKRKQGVPLPVAGSDSSGEEDTLLYATINFVQSTSQPPGNSEESKKTKVELNPYYTVHKQLVSSDNEHIYSLVTVH